MGASAKTARQPSQTLKAVLGIRDLVISGDCAPGERLSEITLAQRLGLSRTPIRAALARLEQEGLLAAITSGGYSVRAFSHADIADAIEMRGTMEGLAVRLAAERGAPPAQLAEMHAIVDALDRTVAPAPADIDFAEYVELNGAFHESLRQLASTAVLRRELERVANLPFAGPSAFFNAEADNPRVRASLPIAQEQHRAILQAIERREGARGEALAREHARLALRNLDYVMENRKAFASLAELRLVKG